MSKKESVGELYSYDYLKIVPNEYGTDEVANRPHAYLNKNDEILKNAITDQTLADHADVQTGITSGAHSFLPVSGDQYTPNVLTRTGANSADWCVGTFKAGFIDNAHPALTTDGKCRIGDGFWYVQKGSNTVRVFSQVTDYSPIISGGYTYFFGGDDDSIPSDVRSTLVESYAFSFVPIARGYSTDGLVFDYIHDLRPLYTPAQMTASVSPSGAIIAQYQPWSKTFTIVSANAGANNVFRHNEPYLPGKGLLNVYLNGMKQSMRGTDNPVGAYAELDPYSILFYDTLEVGDVLELHSDLGFIRNVGIVADFLPGSIAVEVKDDKSVGYIEELPFNYPGGMHMLEVFRNGIRLTSGLDYKEGTPSTNDNKSVTFLIALKKGDIVVYYCALTYVTNLTLSGDIYTNLQVMHGASESYKNIAVSQAFDGVNSPSMSGSLSGMHFYNIDVTGMATSASSIPKITEFELYISIASTSGVFETVGRMAGQIVWKNLSAEKNLLDFNAYWGGYKLSTSSAVTAVNVYPLDDYMVLDVPLGDATYSIVLDASVRKIMHMGLTGLTGASALSASETLQSTLGLKNFSTRSTDTASTSILTYRSFNSLIPDDTSNSKSLTNSQWSIFNEGYPVALTGMEAGYATFDTSVIESKISCMAENYDVNANKFTHLDADITINWAKALCYMNASLGSHTGRVYSLGQTMDLGLLTSSAPVYFESDDNDASTSRPAFMFDINQSTRVVKILFRAGVHGFLANNTTRWAFTTTVMNTIAESIPVLSDRLLYPGSFYLNTVSDVAGRITNVQASTVFGTITNSRTIEAYKADSTTVYNIGNPLFPIIIPSNTGKSIIRLHTRQFKIYESRYNITIDWTSTTFKVTYEILVIRDSGYNIVGREDGSVNTVLTLCQNSSYYKYDTVGTPSVSDGGNPETPTTLADALTRMGQLLIMSDPVTKIKSIMTLPIAEYKSNNPSHFDLHIENYGELNS